MELGELAELGEIHVVVDFVTDHLRSTWGFQDGARWTSGGGPTATGRWVSTVPIYVATQMASVRSRSTLLTG